MASRFARQINPTQLPSGMMNNTQVLLVVATDVERVAIFDAAQALTSTPQLPGLVHGHSRTYHDLGMVDGARIALVQSEQGTSTVGGSLSTIQVAIQELNPTWVIMVGIAFGIDPDKQPIGTILVSKQIQQYEIRRIGTTSEGNMEARARGDRASASPTLLSRLKATASQWPNEVQPGLILSGEKLVDNTDYRDTLTDFEPEALGGEMEGGGLYVAATEHQRHWCVVKAVCDYADGKKRENKEERQRIAAASAAGYVMQALHNGGFGSITKRLGATHSFTDRLAHPNFLDVLAEKPHLLQGAKELLENDAFPAVMIVDGRPMTNPSWAGKSAELFKDAKVTERLRGHMFLIAKDEERNHPGLYCYRSDKWGAYLFPFYKHPDPAVAPQDLVTARLFEHVRTRYLSEPIATKHYMISIKENQEYKGELWLYAFEFYSVVVPADFQLTQSHAWLDLERLADPRFREVSVNGDVIRAIKSCFGVGLHDLPRSVFAESASVVLVAKNPDSRTEVETVRRLQAEIVARLISTRSKAKSNLYMHYTKTGFIAERVLGTPLPQDVLVTEFQHKPLSALLFELKSKLPPEERRDLDTTTTELQRLKDGAQSEDLVDRTFLDTIAQAIDELLALPRWTERD
jgi:nucleoside phosphorylase